MHQPPPTIRLAELLGALSHALDLTEGQAPGHCMRCCWIGVQIGREIGLGDADIGDLYYALLLKDLGCSSNAARICELYLTDDRTFKQDVKRLGDGLPGVLRFVLTHTGPTSGLAERVSAIVEILRNGGEIARGLIETRCERGAAIARQMRFPESVQRGIRDLDEHWDSGGKPRGLRGEAIALSARIALLAQVADVFHAAAGPAAALREVQDRAGRWFDPALVVAFERLARQPGFWERLAAEDFQEALLRLEPAQAERIVDEDYLDDIAGAFARVIDAKSPFTSGHSERVALFTDMVAREMGLSRERRRWLKRAALLHDIGKLGVSNRILDKPGKLDGPEWAAMQGHAAHSQAILSRIAAFGELAQVAGAHHERLDGRGYPHGLGAEEILLETRIISVADVFDALTADRPYRAAMPTAKAFGIMAEGIGTALDPVPFGALREAMERFERAAA